VINDDGDAFAPPFQKFWIRHWLCDVAKMTLLWDDVM